ncbi:MAG: primosomal protein N' [Oscillospiraceae bacterium]|nr:primosomal protein N' [Oscillospiraceae bacterium]
MIAKIAVSAANFAIDKPYSYFCPPEMEILPGMRVMVPFGRSNRHTEGVVLSAENGEAEGLKPVFRALDEQPLLSESMLRLAAFMRERYFCTFFDAIRVMLPAGLWFQSKDTYALTDDRSWQEKNLRQTEGKLLLEQLELLGGNASGEALRQTVPDEEKFDKAITYLLKNKWITAQRDFLRRTGDKQQQIVTLAVSAEEAMAYAATRPKSAAMQRSVLELLCSVGSAPVKEVCYFTGAKPATVRRLAELGYAELTEKEVLRCREIRPAKLDGPLVLNSEQQAAFDGLNEQMHADAPGSALLYGVTGSGKTSVYIKLIDSCIESGKQAILLVPEIALTPQLLGLMAAHFGDRVAVLHSSLPATERYDQWKRIRSGEAKLVVGTRSAVFAPCANLGLIILDEEQEHSYKSENAPRYHAREVALWRGLKEKALVLLGSATPSIESMYYAKTGIYKLYRLHNRFGGRPLPEVEIVDMRQELKYGNDLSLSNLLQNAIRDTEQAGKQVILFLNRRGNSRALVCVDCRESPECPRCSARLTYHSVNERLMCHYCGHSMPAPKRCPSCGGPMKRVGTGTQKVQQELQDQFSDIPVERMDADTVSASNTHEMILDRFQKNNTPVLVGTQMVAKGLNLPNVTLVGVLDGDLNLYTDSYRAAETTFNMLTQVVGRAGRGDTSGRAMIQTLVPDHAVINLAAKQDYDGFYDLEIGLRKHMQTPPFGDIAVITFTGQDEARLLHGAAKLKSSLQSLLQKPEYAGERCTILGPAPCPVPKINYNYRYRLTMRCKMTKPLRLLLAHLLRQFAQDRDNRGVSVFIDVNGFE